MGSISAAGTSISIRPRASRPSVQAAKPPDSRRTTETHTRAKRWKCAVFHTLGKITVCFGLMHHSIDIDADGGKPLLRATHKPSQMPCRPFSRAEAQSQSSAHDGAPLNFISSPKEIVFCRTERLIIRNRAGIKRIKTGTSSTMKHDVDEEAPSSSSIESSHSRRKRFTKADAHHTASLRRTKRGKCCGAKISRHHC